jgi:hypothetical protein
MVTAAAVKTDQSSVEGNWLEQNERQRFYNNNYNKQFFQ